jgi:predicted Fe-Mo cluster-binding NifX family protein
MKIAITCQDNTIDNNIDQRFGRCKYFLIVNIENKKIVSSEAILNQGAVQGHGAGIKAAEQIGELKVDIVLTGQLGPNATSVLDKLEIIAYHASGNAKDQIDKFLNNKLKEISEVAKSHSGIVSNDKNDKSERIFFPLLNNNGEDSEISQHFGHAPFFGVYEVETKKLKIIENNLDHSDPTKSPIDQIEDAVNPTTIFAKGIGARAIDIIQEKGLILKTGDYDTVGEVIKNLDNLNDQTQSCGHKH